MRAGRGLGRGGPAAWAAGLALLAGCAPPPRPPSPEARAAVEAPYRACLSEAVHFVDDHKAAEGEIARLAAPLCYDRFLPLAHMLEDSRPGDDPSFDRQLDELQLRMATEAVRTSRAG